MATPIAHKGVTAGAKVEAMTLIDILTNPNLVKSACGYFHNVQTKTVQYKPLIRSEDQPAIWLNQKIMEQYRPAMKSYYYDSNKYATYLEQLGIKYATLRN
jgi:aminobenzoyl-glutamate utilization protein B